MKSFILVWLTLLFAGSSYAGDWCEWTGDQGVNCQSDSAGYITISGFKVSTQSIANDGGWYYLVKNEPVIGTDQVKDTEVWSFADNQISLTWTVRDMTTEEINNRDAAAMEIGQYYLWKALIVKGVITQQEASSYLPQELIDAYLARQELEQ